MYFLKPDNFANILLKNQKLDQVSAFHRFSYKCDGVRAIWYTFHLYQSWLCHDLPKTIPQPSFLRYRSFFPLFRPLRSNLYLLENTFGAMPPIVSISNGVGKCLSKSLALDLMAFGIRGVTLLSRRSIKKALAFKMLFVLSHGKVMTHSHSLYLL